MNKLGNVLLITVTIALGCNSQTTSKVDENVEKPKEPVSQEVKQESPKIEDTNIESHKTVEQTTKTIQPETVKKSTPKVAINKPVKLTKQKFLEKIWDYEKDPKNFVYKGELPSIIDFYADWCRPCRMVAPILDELAEEYAGKIVIYKIDTQVERELSAAFGIQSLPTFLLIPKNDKPMMNQGIGRSLEETKNMFRQQIDELLLAKK